MQKKEKNDILENELSGYPIYPPSEDLFINNITEKEVDTEDVLIIKDSHLLCHISKIKC